MSENAAPLPPPTDALGHPTGDARLAKRLNLIFEVGRATLSKLDMADLLNTTAEAIHRHFGYYDVSIFLLDADMEECVLVAHAGDFAADGIKGYRQKAGTGVVGWVAQHGHAALVNDVRQDPRHIVAFAGEEQLLSELAVPIRLHDRTLGVINVERREANAFDESDTVALETLSDQIAQAVANAQLFEQTRLLLDLNRGIINAMPSALCVLDEELRVLFVSPAFSRLFGAEIADVKGRAAQDVIAEPLLAAGLSEAILAALDNGQERAFSDLEASTHIGQRFLNVHVSPAQMPEGAGVLVMFEDVTDWRRATALAEQRRAMLDLIVSRVPIAVLSFDLEGRFTFWGAGATDITGYDESEMLARQTPYQIVSDGAALSEAVERCKTTGIAEAEAVIRRKDGSLMPALFVLGKLADDKDRLTGYSAVVLDITERRRAAEELLREKQKLEHVVSVIGAGLALIDKDHQVIWANHKIDEWFGDGRSMVGRQCHEIYCHRGSACVDCPSEQCFRGGASGETEVTLVRSDGAMRQYHHAVTPVFGPDGKVDHVLKLTMDVTDQTKKVYQLSRLRQFGELMQGVLDLDRLLHFVLTCVTAGQALGFNRALLLLADRDRNVMDGRMGVGPDSAEEAGRIWRQISRESPTLEDLLGLHEQGESPREPTGMDRVAQSVHISLDDEANIVIQCARSRQPILVQDADHDSRVNEDIRRLIGARQFVLAPLIAHNRPVGVIIADNRFSGQPITGDHVELLSMFANQAAIAIDNAENYRRIGEEKAHLERAYRQLTEAQDKLVRSERLVAIGRMATHVAHEIRNPLVTIGGFANSMLTNKDLSADESSRYARIIVDEVKRLENILARVMDFTRPPKPMFAPAPVVPIIKATLDQLQDRIRTLKVQVDTDLPEPEPPVQADPNQLKQVFLNLLQNALDVMGEGDRLTVTMRSDPQNLRIVIANTGQPIRPEDAPKMFEPFYTTKPGGTGLGLVVSQKIIQDHGGEITFQSSMEQGTEFIITLPREVKPGFFAMRHAPY